MADNHQKFLFEEDYFASSCGRPYKRDEPWLRFFEVIAQRIVEDLHPESVLDAGCAMGFLVEKLREKDVAAFGIDISEYAIGNVHHSVREFCTIGSISEKLDRHYDLIVCMEVLEHLSPDEAQEAINNLCTHSSQILFSSTPLDHMEPTHINVQPPEYWADSFSRQGFYRDLSFDSSFVTPWASLFRGVEVGPRELVRTYEAALWSLQQDNTALRMLSSEIENLLTEFSDSRVFNCAQPSQDQINSSQIVADPSEQSFLSSDAGRLFLKLRTRYEQLTRQIEAHVEELAETKNQMRDQQKQLRDQAKLTEEISVMESSLEDAKKQLQANVVVSDELERRMESLQAEKESQERELRALEANRLELAGKLTEIEVHIGWRLTGKFQRLRLRVIPHHSRREIIWKNVVAFGHAWMDLGFRGAAKKSLAKISGKPLGHTPHKDYVAWMKHFEASEEELQAQERTAGEFSYQPLISIITPVFNPSPDVLRAAISSVQAQTYVNWELCLADGASEDPQITMLLHSLHDQDPRIRVQLLDENFGIAGNSNKALEMAQGDFVAFLDHDDTLAPNAIFEVVQALNEDQTLDLIYFDEDKLSGDGKIRKNPWFKPDWSPELLLSANYLMHSVVRRQLIGEIGGFDSRMEGAQDWDLLFKVTEHTEKIFHIPKVLYHWREVPGSAASDLMAKPWVFTNQLLCVKSHLERIGLREVVTEFDSPGFLRVSWPTKGSKVSVIIPTKDQVALLRRCISSIKKFTKYVNYEIIVIDNESREDETFRYYDEIKTDENIKIIAFPGDFNFSAANNLGAGEASGDVYLFLNNDIEILESGWMEELVRWVERPEIGVVGAKLLYPNGHIQHAGVIIGMQGHASHVFMGSLEKQTGPFGSVDWYRDYSAVTGACMMIQREVFDKLGGFDEDYVLAFSDVELCIRVRNEGFRVLYNPFVRVRHFEGQSRGQRIPVEDIKLGYIHMKDLVASDDPYFNPNLSYGSRIPFIAQPDEISRIKRLEEIVAFHSKSS